ncbi:MAG TPA: molybdopterin-dependent oxidoreductase [Pseudacidobacterium sp.]|jgi:anaerobic selenocysteine-containing dehydrogenase|nr:molybdopterin-dependent oxidoreductase [Pseudacidobacterium sp.]
MPAAKTIHTVCSHDCPDSCGVLVTVDEAGRATRVQGDPNHPVTRGFLCGKVAKYLDRVYSPDRLLYPMRRRSGVAKGPLPQGKEAEAFERISWDEALGVIAKRLQQISDEHGPESILPYSYAGTIGTLGYGSMDRRFFHRLGASQLDRTICATAGGDALVSVYGRKLGTDTETFPHARYIIAWGANIHGNNIHLWPFIEEARRNGAKLVVIDPYKTRTAKLADWHIAINPGTDTALALGLMHVILHDGLEDRAYIAENTHGFEALNQHVENYTPERVSAWTGLTPEEIVRLAREYATTTPAVIRMNYGVQRSENGGAASRAIAMLPALTGAWKHKGGGFQLSTSGAFSWDKVTIERPDLMLASPLKRHARVVNMSLLGHALTELKDPPVKALFVYNSNPAAIAPDQSQVLGGMGRPDLFTVVHEQFFTDTTDYADIVLPATTFLEHKDVQGAYGHYYVQISNPAIEPPGEAWSNVRIFSELAQRMGFTEPCFRDTPEDLIAQALRTSRPENQEPWMAGITESTLNAAGGHQHLQFSGGFLPFAKGPFPTPSGKIEFYSEMLAKQGIDPLPTFHPPAESRHNAPSEYPLEFLPRKADNYMNSTFANLPGHQRMEAAFTNYLEMRTEDAVTRGILDGDTVEIFNDRGRLRMTAHINGSVPRGTVASRLNWNKLSPDGHNVNLLTSQRLTDIGGGPTFYSTLVEVRKVVS